ncbi:hypothetical protein C8Q79DRAFT_1009311 [Trametes meyenii]|nr:hypothetical protein C8Q79DRAFT_1009311 [Trametes meyenii]
MARLLDLPDEVLASILAAADPRDLLICRRVCRIIARALQATRLQHKMELGMAGMVDGPPSDVNVSDRLAALRAYRAAWKCGKHPSHVAPWSYSTAAKQVSRLGPLTLVWAADEGVLKVYSPPSAFCGIPGRYEALQMVAKTRMSVVPISPTRLVGVDQCDQYEMLFHVFRLNPALAAPPPRVFVKDSLFTLCMPRLREGAFYCYGTPAYDCFEHPPTPPKFQRDPALSMLAVQTDVFHPKGEDMTALVHGRYVVCTPLPTLLADYENARGGGRADVPWELWGPRGARIFKIDIRAEVMSVVGAQVRAGGSQEPGALDPSAVHVLEAPDVFDEQHDIGCEGTVRSTYPFSITHWKVALPALPRRPRYVLSDIALGHDGLVLHMSEPTTD